MIRTAWIAMSGSVVRSWLILSNPIVFKNNFFRSMSQSDVKNINIENSSVWYSQQKKTIEVNLTSAYYKQAFEEAQERCVEWLDRGDRLILWTFERYPILKVSFELLNLHTSNVIFLWSCLVNRIYFIFYLFMILFSSPFTVLLSCVSKQTRCNNNEKFNCCYLNFGVFVTY